MSSLSFCHELSVRIPYLNLRIDLGSSSVFLINSPDSERKRLSY